MGLRSWLLHQLERGDPPQLDSEEMVELCNLTLANGPLALAALESAGIRAQGFDAIDIRSEVRNRMRIMVRRADLTAAESCLDGLY